MICLLVSAILCFDFTIPSPLDYIVSESFIDWQPPTPRLTPMQSAVVQNYLLPVALGDLNGDKTVNLRDWALACDANCYKTAPIYGADASELKANIALFVEQAGECNDVARVKLLIEAYRR